MQLRYMPQTEEPHVIGGVDDFDLYLTESGTAVVRWSDRPGARYITRKDRTDPKVWLSVCRDTENNQYGDPIITEEQAERIALVFKLFGPEWEK